MSNKRVALLGNSNVGKSSLFNILTGQSQQVTNAPGTTVSVESGIWGNYELIDLPGLISMFYISPDEEVSAKAVMHKDSIYAPNLIILVADAMHLSRGLYLLAQAKSSNLPVILAITMTDLAKKHNVDFNIELIRKYTEVDAVVLVDGRTGEGLDSLKEAVDLHINDQKLDSDISDVKQWAKDNSEKHFAWVEKTISKIGLKSTFNETFADKIDKVLLHKFIGPLVFLLFMFLLFQLTTTFANPIIDLIDNDLREVLNNIVSNLLVVAPQWVQSLVLDVFVETVITISTFLPPMFFMFIFLAILEESGYLARAAFVNDRLMRFMGLDGRSLIPLILGYGCNLPAVSATRALNNSKSRLTTGYLLPFTLCSARLAVYVVLSSIFFKSMAGLVVFALYLISILILFIGGIIMNKILKSNFTPLPFIISLPSYQLPKLSSLFKMTLLKLWQFIVSAGSVIAVTIVVMWLLQSAPLPNATDSNGQKVEFAQVDDMSNSVYGATANIIAPIFRPAGFGDWHLSSAILTGFVAKEVVISNMQNAYGSEKRFNHDVKLTFSQSSNHHPRLAAFSFMLFILLYTPCLATVAGLKKEFGLKMALSSVSIGLITAFVVSISFFQIACLIF